MIERVEKNLKHFTKENENAKKLTMPSAIDDEFFLTAATNSTWTTYFAQSHFSGKKACSARKDLFFEWSRHQYYLGFCSKINKT